MFKKQAIPVALAAALLGSPAAHAAAEFNPEISLILDGRYQSYSNDSDYELPGFMLGGEAGRGEEGFNLGHNELVLSANIDDRYYGKMTTVIADHDGETEVELEEAFIETMGLGGGCAVKAGRFFSGIGYLNSQHPHSWDFADAPLVYQGLFGGALRDDGLQLSWIAPTDTYLKLGLEATRGARFPAGGSANDGAGAAAAFIKIGGDIGTSHAWQLGLSRWQAEVEERESGAGHTHGEESAHIHYSGDSDVTGIDLVWKWAPEGNATQQNFTFQAEYFLRNEEGEVEFAHEDESGSATLDGEQSGWYAQAVYQFMPRWRVGLRYDRLAADNRLGDFALTGIDEETFAHETGLDNEGHDPNRTSVMLDYSRSEYSRIRLQLA
ncbi:MAG: hypothetical protein OQK94_08895, partial [Gammaproteobacteria bacterium]|nr:hypothetical protein [Gammaproteobacteria bacterium]